MQQQNGENGLLNCFRIDTGEYGVIVSPANAKVEQALMLHSGGFMPDSITLEVAPAAEFRKPVDSLLSHNASVMFAAVAELRKHGFLSK